MATPPHRSASVRQAGPSRTSRRDAILLSAIDRLTAVGYLGTSLRDIAQGAGVTTTSISHHFGSKQGVLREIMVAAITEVVELTQAALRAAPDEPVEQLLALMRAWIWFHTNRQPHAVISATELRNLEGEGLSTVLARRDEQGAIFRRVVERGVATGVFATPYPREATRAVLQMGRDVSSWYRPGGGVSPEELAVAYGEPALGLVRARARPTGKDG
jgi:AcrR family transcriptional regulator